MTLLRPFKPKTFRPDAVYTISADDSKRIQIWRLWMTFFMPLRHIYTSANRIGGAESALLFEPEWLSFIQHILVEIVARCVPSAFAFISAVLLYRKPFTWRENTVRKFRSLMLPLFLLTSFWVAVYTIGPYIPGIGSMFSAAGTRVADWTPELWLANYLGWTPQHHLPNILYPLWFLRDLMIVNLLAPVIKWIIDRFPRLFLLVLAALLVWKTDNRYFFHAVHQVFIFFCLGCYVVKYDLHFSDLDRIPAIWIALPYFLSIAAAYILRDYADVHNAVRGIPNLLGILFFAKFVSRFPPSPKWKKRLLWLAQYNVCIFLFHERMITFAKRLALRMLPACLPTTLLILYILPALIVAVCVTIGWLLHKYQPRFYKLITGSR